jgi:O-antigen/teichoic acid export membrane protein
LHPEWLADTAATHPEAGVLAAGGRVAVLGRALAWSTTWIRAVAPAGLCNGLSKLVLTRYAGMAARSGASIADQGAGAVVSFLASILVGRQLGTEALGIYAITNVFVALIRTLQDCLVLEPMAVFGARRTSEERHHYYGFLLGLETVWVGMLTALLAAGAAVAWSLGSIDTRLFHAITASCVFSFIFCFLYFRRRQFYVELRQFRALAQSMSYLLLVAIAFATLLLFKGWSVWHVYLVLALCSAIACVAGRDRANPRSCRPSRAQIRRYATEHWHFAKWILLGIPLGMVAYQGYFFVMGAVVSTEAAGLLKAAEALIAPFTQISTGMRLMLIPMAARRIDQMSSAQQRRYAVWLACPLLAMAGAYGTAIYFGGEYALRALFGEQIAGAFPLVHVMAFIPLFMAAPQSAAIVLSSLRRTNMRFISECIACVGTLLIGLPLVFHLGLIGGAFGMMLTEALLTVGYWGCLLWVVGRGGTSAKPGNAEG